MTHPPLRPPEPIGEPYQGDPGAPSPFAREGEVLQSARTPPTTEPPVGTASPGGRAGAGSAFPSTPEQRFARTALWLGIASVFIFNLVIGPVAIVMGVIAIRRGERRTGRLALLCGALGTFIGILLLVLVSAGVLPSVDEMLEDLRSRR